MNQYNASEPITAPGYIAGMPAEIYHAHDSISNSGLKLIGRSPAHFKYGAEREATRAMVVGSALHMAILEPNLYRDTYVRLHGAENRVCAEYKEAKKEFGEDRVLVKSECEKIEGIAASLFKSFPSELSVPGATELSGFSTDPETGVICRHRFDKLMQNNVAIDIKTTIDARPDAFSSSIQSYGYHMQAAFYSDQFEWITGEKLNGFLFLAVEASAPYACKMYRLDHESMEIGRAIYRKYLKKYAECRNANEWPAYGNNKIDEIGIPAWAVNQFEKQRVDDFIFMED